MVNTISDIFYELDFVQYHRVFLDNSYYEILFPFLLSFAILYTILGKVSLFQNKKTRQPMKPIVFVVSLVVSWFGVGFETSSGYNVGKLLMMMFPNISALTMGILCLYIVGAILGKNFFKEIFSRSHGAYIYFAIGAIGLGAVVYYWGIVMGLWNFDPLDAQSYWNVVIAVGLLVLGITLIVIGFLGYGIVLLFVFGAYVYSYGEGNILEYFIDPFVFIAIIVILLLTWLGSDRNEKDKLKAELNDTYFSLQTSEKQFGKDPYKSRIYDIQRDNFDKNVEKWKSKYGDENWEVK